MPSSVERYHQEIGRAGRDGYDAECVLFYDNGDKSYWLSRFANGELSNDVFTGKVRSLKFMSGYGISRVCRHVELMTYFGQQADLNGCGGVCDNCVDRCGVNRQSDDMDKEVSITGATNHV